MYIFPTNIKFTDKHKDEMLECAKKGDWLNHESHHSGQYQPYQFITDYSGRLKVDDSILKAKEIITEKIKEPDAIFVMRLPPWTDMHIHIDTYTKPGEYRRTVIMTLLSPRNYKEETRLEYYKEDKKTITETHCYNDGQSIITDATVFHKCFNQTPDWRYSLQVTFKDEVDYINNIINS
jgi:hypothetical protein